MDATSKKLPEQVDDNDEAYWREEIPRMMEHEREQDRVKALGPTETFGGTILVPEPDQPDDSGYRACLATPLVQAHSIAEAEARMLEIGRAQADEAGRAVVAVWGVERCPQLAGAITTLGSQRVEFPRREDAVAFTKGEHVRMRLLPPSRA